MQNYLKSIAAVIGSAVTVLTPYYGSQHWFAGVVGALTVLGVYVAPNKAASDSQDESKNG